MMREIPTKTLPDAPAPQPPPGRLSLALRAAWRYGAAAAAVAAGMGLRLALTAWVGPGLPTYITFYPAVMVVALLAGFGPGLLATVLAALTATYWLLEPKGLTIESPVDWLGLLLFLCMGAFMSAVAGLYRRGRQRAVAMERELALRESVEALRAAAERERFLAAIVENASQAFGVGYPDGSLGMVNRAFEELTGYSAEELRAMEWTQTLTPPEWRATENEKLRQLQRTGQPVRYEKEYVRKDGTRVPIELLVHLVRDAEGSPQYYYSFITDVTERRRAEEQARRAAAELAERVAQLQAANAEIEKSRAAAVHLMTDAVAARDLADRSAAELARSNEDLQQFAYVASHDLQEPLRAVAGFMGILRRKHQDRLDAEAIEFIAQAIEGAERMQALINDLLTYSRVGSRGGAFEPVSLASALDGALRNLSVAIEEAGATVTADPLPTVVADGPQMIQLLQNLIANAVKFHGPARPEIHVGASREAGQWVVSVSDNGIGIEPQYFDRIFLIFQKLHSRTRYSGTGIGLAVCKKIAERHGGAIWVESRPGEGSVFHFAIPDRGENP